MSVSDELVERRKELNQKKYELLLYLMESRKIRGDISGITYRQNSGIDSGYETGQRKKQLKDALRQMDAELERRYHLSPRMVEYQINLYNDELRKIGKQIDDIDHDR